MPKKRQVDQERIYQDTEIVKQQFQAFEEMIKNSRKAMKEFGSFEQFNEKLKALVDQFMTPYFRDPFGNGTYTTMEPEKFHEFLGAYGELLQLSDKLQKELDPLVNDPKVGGLVRPMMETLKYAGGMMEKDVAFLAGLNASKGIVLPEALKEARSKKLSINHKKIDTVGGNLSSRIPVTFTDEKGVVHKGFFTKDKIIHFKDQTKEVLLEAIEKTDDSQDFKNLMKQYINTIFRHPEIANDPEALTELLVGVVEDKASGGKRYLRSKFAYNLQMQGKELKKEGDPPEEWSFFGTMPKEGEADTRTEEQKRNRAAFDEKFKRSAGRRIFIQNMNHYFHSLAVTVVHNPKNHDLIRNYKLMSQMEGSSLYQRNSAMSAVANLLGIGRVVAHSENMTMNIDGEAVPGVFMEQAQGEDLSRAYPGSKLDKMLQKKEIKGSTMQANKDLLSLQILDYICNNIDRHRHNCLYQVRNNEIVGLQGIDNDRSFGTAVYEDNENLDALFYPLNIIQLGYIPKDLAAAIEQLNPKVLDLVLKGYQLSEEERNAALKRLDQIKEASKKRWLMPVDDKMLGKDKFLHNYLRIIKWKSPLGNALDQFGKYIRQSTEVNENPTTSEKRTGINIEEPVAEKKDAKPAAEKKDAKPAAEKKDAKPAEKEAQTLTTKPTESKDKKNVKPAKPIKYTKAQYSREAGQPVNTEALDRIAEELLKTKADNMELFSRDGRTLMLWHEDMLEMDKHVTFGSKQFEKLENAVQSLAAMDVLALRTALDSRFSRKLRPVAEEELVQCLENLKDAANAYLARKKPDKKRNAAEQRRYDRAVELRQFAEARIETMKDFKVLAKNPEDQEQIVTYDLFRDYLAGNTGRLVKNGNQFIYSKMLKELEGINPQQFDQDQFTRTEMRAAYKSFAKEAGPLFHRVFNEELPKHGEATFEEANNVYYFMKKYNEKLNHLMKLKEKGFATPEKYQSLFNEIKDAFDPSQADGANKSFESKAKRICQNKFLNILTTESGMRMNELLEGYEPAQPKKSKKKELKKPQVH